jgi:yecA family protein
LASDLVLLRAWMPGDVAQSKIDALIRQVMKRGIVGGPRPKPWKLHKVLASLPDGTGAQGIALALQSGSRRGVAMLLIKQDHGVKDAYVVPCSSAGEQRRLLAGIENETGALEVTSDYTGTALAAALADGLANGMPPAAGLVEVARLCGFTDVRPEVITTEQLVQDSDPEGRIRAKSPQARGRLINESEFWRDRFAIIESWFEESDALSHHLDTCYSSRSFDKALWKWLESRRDWWTHNIARSARVLVASGDGCADAFVATAQALQAGRNLPKTPIMRDIFEQTRDLWTVDGLQVDSEIATETLPDDAQLPAPPRAEKPGELRRLLQGADISADWVDGYLAAICLAPKMIAPGVWLEILLPYAMAALSEKKLQRFLDLLILRYNALSDQLSDPVAMDAVLGSMSDLDLEDWADGFSDGYESFKSAWPAKTLSKNDRAMLRHIRQVSREPQSRGGSFALLAPWLAARAAQV